MFLHDQIQIPQNNQKASTKIIFLNLRFVSTSSPNRKTPNSETKSLFSRKKVIFMEIKTLNFRKTQMALALNLQTHILIPRKTKNLNRSRAQNQDPESQGQEKPTKITPSSTVSPTRFIQSSMISVKTPKRVKRATTKYCYI